MANVLFDSYRETLLLSTCVDLSTVAVDFDSVDTLDDTVDPAVDDFLDDILVAAREINWGPLGSKTTTDGTFDAADPTATAASGDQFEELIMYEDTGTPATSDLVLSIDTATGLPFTPSGGDITLQFDAAGIFTA